MFRDLFFIFCKLAAVTIRARSDKLQLLFQNVQVFVRESL